jgi:thymidylate synthase (FAD)
VIPDKIVSIEYAGIREVYDIEMCEPYKNFVANSIVVHNCSYDKDKFGNEVTIIEPVFYKNIPEERKYTIRNMFTKEFKQPIDLVDTLNNLEKRYADWFYSCYVAEASYLEMLHYGAEPQEARDVLPTSTKTEVIMTMNMREIRHFFKLRAAGTTGKPHPQMVEVALPLLRQCQQIMPELFGDIEVIE